jgi:GNAT superfamily N-acetyltransferase
MEVSGYIIKVEKGIDVETFLVKHFPGFSPVAVSDQANQLLAPMTSKPIERQWQLSDPQPRISFFFASQDAFNERTGVCLSRTFRWTAEGVNVYHDYFTIPEQYRHQGIGRMVLKTWFELYERMKVQHIHLQATLEDGGYVWARAGFKATRRKDVDKILALAKLKLGPELFRVIKAYYDDHYNNFPEQPFALENWARLSYMKPVLKNCSWYGQIDLTNYSEMTNFKNYVYR